MLRVLVLGLVVSLAAMSLAAAPPKEATVKLEVIGMHCEPCADVIQASLQKVKGVKDAKVSFNDKEAVIRYDPDQCKVETLVQAVRETKGMAEFSAKVKTK